MQAESLLNQKYDRIKFTLANPSIWEKLAKIKGPPFMRYRQLLHQAEQGEVLTDFPLEILIKTTLNCNHACHKCLHGLGIFPQGEQYNMRFKTLQKVLDEGAEKGLQSVVFTGGEPTLHPQITQFIEYAGKKGFPDLSLVTNGSLLTDRIFDCLLDSGVTRINVSIDSITPATFIKVRGVDEYDKVVKNVEHFLDQRAKKNSLLPLLSVSFVLSEENAHELDDFIEQWHDKADAGIKIYPYKDVFSIVDENFSKTYGAGQYTPADIKKEVFPTTLAPSKQIMEGYSVQCMIPWYRCHVGINGEIQGCTTQGFCDHPLMMMGNIHQDTFEAIWKSERWNLLRQITRSKEFARHPVCRICQQSVQQSTISE